MKSNALGVNTNGDKKSSLIWLRKVAEYGWERWQSTVTMDSFPEPSGRAVLAS